MIKTFLVVNMHIKSEKLKSYKGINILQNIFTRKLYSMSDIWMK